MTIITMDRSSTAHKCELVTKAGNPDDFPCARTPSRWIATCL
jgi:hypothetical protein